MFSFLYRVFYDRTLFSLYVEKGKGYGLKPLFFLTLFAALCLSLRLLWTFSAVTPQAVDGFVSKIPQIVFEKGEIVSPENERFSYVSQEAGFFFVFDTTKNPVNLTGLPDTGIYMTSDALVTVRRNQTHRVPFVKLFEKPDFTLDQNNIRSGIEEMLSLLKIFLPPVMFVFCIPGIFCAYVIMTLFGVVLSFFMTRQMKMPLKREQRVRLSVLSIMPAGIINVTAVLLGVHFHLGLFEIAVVAVFMYCFLKDGRKESVPSFIEKA